MKQVANKAFPDACFILLSCFNPEVGGDIFFRNLDLLSTNYTEFYSIRQNSESLQFYQEFIIIALTLNNLLRIFYD